VIEITMTEGLRQ